MEVEHGGQWVEVEVMVLYSPSGVFVEVVHHQAPADVGHVRERAVAIRRVHVRDQTREPRSAIHTPQVRANDEPADHPVRVQVDDDQLRFAMRGAICRTHVDHPQTVACVYAQPKRVDDPVDGPFPARR